MTPENMQLLTMLAKIIRSWKGQNMDQTQIERPCDLAEYIKSSGHPNATDIIQNIETDADEYSMSQIASMQDGEVLPIIISNLMSDLILNQI